LPELPPAAAKPDIFAAVCSAPACEALLKRAGAGGVLPCPEIAPPAHAFLAALLARHFPDRPVVLVTNTLKAQESLHADLATWLNVAAHHESADKAGQQVTPKFFPAWEVLPHENKLPHADIISERLETLVGSLKSEVRSPKPGAGSPKSKVQSPKSAADGTDFGLWTSDIGLIVVASVTALQQRTFAPDELRTRTRSYRRGDTINPLDLIEWLEEVGYEPETQVTNKGELAWRGGIVDVWPLSSPWPVRLEFFGDELESLREFDPHSQSSREQIEAVVIPPAGEISLLKQRTPKWAEAEPSSGTGILPVSRASSPSDEAFGAASPADRLEACPTSPATRHASLPLGTLLDYLPDNTLLLLCEPDALLEQSLRYRQQVPEGDPFFVAWDELLGEAQRRGMTIVELSEPSVGRDSDELTFERSEASGASFSPHSEAMLAALAPLRGKQGSTESRPTSQPEVAAFSLVFESLDAYRPIGATLPEAQVAEAQRREFFQQMHRWLRQDHAVHVFCNTEGERQRFTELWNEYGLGMSPKSEVQGPKSAPAESDFGLRTLDSGLTVHLGSLSRGFLVPDARLVVVTDAEIYGRYKVARARRLKSPHAQAMRSAFEVDFTDFEEGDYVVHLQNGIGIFRGLKTLPPTQRRTTNSEQRTANNEGQECLVIEFAPSGSGDEPPKLYVPVTEAHLVSKYVGAGKARPQLSTLTGTRWTKAKQEAERAVRDLAGDLLRVQAARATQTGHPFTPDNNWQREFESAFEFEETPDQLKAIEAVKRDLETPKPMDRLLCGDVGFGKTEVAIRAAFKAVMGGKQVALLVPTTVLAQQHYNNFRERMTEFPVRVELMSRFRTPKQQRAVMEAAASGTVDIVIGTHRIVSADMQFKDLGLVIVDEEQKFGVKHKETFKLLRTTVDVLTLSATPIPRTLYLALTGARDLSTLETPPQDRLPVETIVGNYDERVIRDAIQRELNRGGQVYLLHNRVSTIEGVALKLKALLPDARIAIGHGQMDDDELEKVMTRFVNGEADVLVSTTIIESGLDIPNANTIIIDRADRFGLSELYQLRGRVGRYKHQAYCYLLLPRHAQLLTEARKRMSAIKQYSALGSGFKIAMRDLEIRGAGNLLGPQQSGHITAVGFDLYCQLLKQSIASLKGEKVAPRVEVRVSLDFLAMNPGEEISKSKVQSPKSKESEPAPDLAHIEIPREDIWRWAEEGADSKERRSGDSALRTPHSAVPKSPAYLPLDYIRESEHRLEIYRKLAQATQRTELEALKRELRDRFGPLHAAVELLVNVHELRVLAAAKQVTAVEVTDGKVKFIRNREPITVGGYFPRLSKPDAKGRLAELRKLLLSL
jgi:transcription-repair coupling factor (superfamily II helicase)